MTNNIQNTVEKLNIIHRRRQIWYRILSFLMCVTVFVTTYALILPAITMDKDEASKCGIFLSSANNRKYTWTSEKGHSRIVVQRNVPKDYTVAIEKQDTTFTVTNSADKGSDSPGTADMTDIYLYLMLMALSGTALIYGA